MPLVLWKLESRRNLKFAGDTAMDMNNLVSKFEVNR